MTLPGKFLGGFSGILVADFGYAEFFTISAIMGIPAVMLVLFLMSRGERLDALSPKKTEQLQPDSEAGRSD
jgi:PAT family beta-lactamase induction signal transducer AmpG